MYDGEFKDRLKLARKLVGITQAELAKKVEIAQPTYSMLERGKGSISSEKINRLAKELQVQPLWLTTGMGQVSQSLGNGIHVTGNNTNNGVQIGSQINHYADTLGIKMQRTAPLLDATCVEQFINSKEDGDYRIYLPYLGDYGDDRVFWLPITTDSMLPDFKRGDYVLINVSKTPLAGNFVTALLTDSNQAVFGKWRPKGFDDTGTEYWHLVHSNQEYPIIDSRHQSFKVAGVAVECSKKLV